MMNARMLPLLLLSLFGNPVLAQQSQRIAVVNVDVLTMEDGASYRRSQTVLIEGDAITAVGPNLAAPANARRIDGSGLVLLPGLRDVHVHLEADPASWIGSFLGYGVTTVLNLRGNPTHLELRERVKRGEVIGPRVYTSGPYVNRPEIETEQQAAAAARAQKTAGYDVLKIHGPLGGAAYRTLIDTAHAATACRRPCAAQSSLRQRDRAEAGHGRACRRTDLHEVHHTRHDADWGSAGAYGGGKDLADRDALHLSRHRRAVGSRGCSGLRAEDGGGVAAESGSRSLLDAGESIHRPPGRRRAESPCLPVSEATVRRLHQAGVRIATGTDTPVPVMVPGASLHLEIAELHEAGLGNYDAPRRDTKSRRLHPRNSSIPT
jgi:hypothetical protein